MKSRLLGIRQSNGAPELQRRTALAARLYPNEQLLNRLTEGGERSGSPAVLFASTQPQPELRHLTKLIVKTVHCGPAELFFPSLRCICRGDEQS